MSCFNKRVVNSFTKSLKKPLGRGRLRAVTVAPINTSVHDVKFTYNCCRTMRHTG